MKKNLFSRSLAIVLCLMMVASLFSVSTLAASFDEAVTGDYYNVLSKHEYTLAPGATETEIILNNDDGSRRQVAHVMEIDTKNPTIQIVPGYYGIDKLDPENLTDKTYWKASPLTETVKYYENNLNYNVIGAMNTALAYDSDAPYTTLRWNGVDLALKENHTGTAATYLAVKTDGTCELRAAADPLEEDDWTAVGANFGWLIKDGVLVTKTVERTTSPASRSMVGIKADGTLVLCQADGRNAPTAIGLSNYEMGEMMLALGCVNAFNCDGGGSSTFITKREGEDANVMRSIPSDGAERATLNSVMVVSTARPTGIFDHSIINSDYDYFVPGSSYAFSAQGIDDAGYEMDVPADVSWTLSDTSFGTVEGGVFTAADKIGTVDVQMVYGGNVVGSKTVNIVAPAFFGFESASTVIPYGKQIALEVVAKYGADNAKVYLGDRYSLAISDSTAATLEGNILTATTDESKTGVKVTAVYLSDTSVTSVLTVEFGKGSEIVYDFEDGDVSNFVGFDEAKQWSIDNSVSNSLIGASPIGGQYSPEVDSSTFLATKDNGGQVKNGEYALGWKVDNTNAAFSGWTYNILFHLGVPTVLRDVANGKKATTFGMWMYIPEGAAGLAMQLQAYMGSSAETAKGGNIHFYFTTVSGASKTLNAATEADIPESRWVYATASLTGNNYVSMVEPKANTWGREPSFIRTYIKPTLPAVHTFYFDDFTLDYSSAVDDRVLPKITNLEYSPSPDSPAALNEGMTIVSHDANKIIHGFSATVTDNQGLDETTRQIYIDGVPVKTSISGNKMFSTYHHLLNGSHTITFEIADKLGNYARVTRNVVFKDGTYDVTLSGHNESGELAEYGSVYYIDLDISDLSVVDKLTTTLKLQNANTWEPQGAIVADGFKASFDYNENSYLLDVVIEKTDDVEAKAGTIVSIPVRVWTWDGINHTTGAAITPETQFASGDCPIVPIDCKIVYGNIESDKFNEYDMGAFGGSYKVDTKLNDIENPWHYHTAEEVDDKLATCTEDGYTGRTYCEGCSSVVDWGTVIPATGHNYVMNAENKLVCSCGDALTINGIYKDGEIYRYLMNGVAKSGWFTVDKDWYYFHPDTLTAKAGSYKVGVVTYEFEETGKLVSGVWAKTLFGTRYYYGPSCYAYGWQVIDGKNYYFEDTYRYEGYRLIFKGNARRWYYFDENGVCSDEQVADGFYTDKGGTSYVKDGLALTGLFKVENDYYYSGYWGYLIGGKQYASSTSCDLPVGNYEFDENGKMLQGIVEKDGKLYYYVNGVTGTYGLVKVGEDYYFSNYGGVVMTNGKYYVATSYCDLPVGNYYFDESGKLANGLVMDGDKLVFAVNGKTNSAYSGLHKIGEDYYYALWNGNIATNGKYFVANTFCDLPVGNYEFGADGKMLNGIVEKDGKLYHYVNGLTGTYGLVKVGEDYYFSNWGGVIMTDGKYFVADTRCDLPVGNYEFGADGKMLNGIVEKDGKLYHYVNGLTDTYGLIKVGEDYYFSNYGGVIMTNGKYYVATSFCDLPAGNYEFDENGKMLNGIVEKDGKLYHYVNGLTGTYGLIKVGEDYYFSNYGGVIMTNGKYYVDTSFCDLPAGNYEFDENGKMLNGIIERDGNYYFYKNGSTSAPGLIYYEGDYYFVNWGGQLVTNQTYYVWNTNGYTVEGNYKFDELGRIYA